MNLKIISLILIPFSLHAQNSYKILLNDSSRLIINGSSNIIDYSCELTQELSLKPLIVNVTTKNRSFYTENAQLYLQVNLFDCGLAKMNRDFQETLKAEEYPIMKIQVNQIYQNLPGDLNLTDSLSANVIITIADVSNYYDIKFSYRVRSDGLIEINGSQFMQMQDFAIEPPTTFFGLIRVYGELEIELKLLISMVEF